MKAVVSLTPEEYKESSETYANLKEKLEGTTMQDWFEEYERQSKYARYNFRGKISTKLVDRLGREPTPDEIIMLVDSGFSHFGASCSIYKDGTFKGHVNVD